jgi:hypothetical protein
MTDFFDEYDFEDEYDEDGLPTDPELLAALTKIIRLECEELDNPLSYPAMFRSFPFEREETMTVYRRKIILMERDQREDYAQRLRRKKSEFEKYWELLMLTEKYRN